MSLLDPSDQTPVVRARLLAARSDVVAARATVTTCRTVAWVGDFNNVARSLSLGAAMCGMRLRIASPAGYGPSEADIDRLVAAGLDGPPVVVERPAEAARGVAYDDPAIGIEWPLPDAILSPADRSRPRLADAETFA